MTDRTELLEAALDSLPDGIVLASQEGQVMFWNRAAEAITGHSGAVLVGQPVPQVLETLIVGGARQWTSQTDMDAHSGRGSQVHVRHRLGHELPVMARILVLRDGMGERTGMAASFIPRQGWMRCPTRSVARVPAWKRARRTSKTGWRPGLKILPREI
jgi:PAS domain S-box-containing protein